MRDKVQNWQLTDSTSRNTIVMKKVCRDYFDLDHFDNQVAIKLMEFFFFHNLKLGKVSNNQNGNLRCFLP